MDAEERILQSDKPLSGDIVREYLHSLRRDADGM